MICYFRSKNDSVSPFSICKESNETHKLVFMGDSRLRQFYKAFKRIVQYPGAAPEKYEFQAMEHYDLFFKSKSLVLHFVWAPKPHDIAIKLQQDYREMLSDSSLVLFNSGLHSIGEFGHNGYDKALLKFGDGMDKISRHWFRLIPLRKCSLADSDGLAHDT